MQCLISPFTYSTQLCVDDLLNSLQQDPQMPALEDPASANISSTKESNYGMHAHSESNA